jgi:hypothetical protein
MPTLICLLVWDFPLAAKVRQALKEQTDGDVDRAMDSLERSKNTGLLKENVESSRDSFEYRRVSSLLVPLQSLDGRDVENEVMFQVPRVSVEIVPYRLCEHINSHCRWTLWQSNRRSPSTTEQNSCFFFERSVDTDCCPLLCAVERSMFDGASNKGS